MFHENIETEEIDHASKIKTEIGLILFIVYGLIYSGFIAINTIYPVMMETIIFFGLNLAVVYGFGLIILAILMGLIYNIFCTKKENELNKKEGDK